MAAFYNENDPFCAQWLRNLIAKGLIVDGDVDERSIKEVQPDDIRNYTQVHLFAGLGGWSAAFRLAKWPDDHPIWTGSCPCQPFSVAGRHKGTLDERHLWPDFFRLVATCHPPVIMGEQVSGAAGYAWLDGVAADLEGESYTVGAVDIPACAVGAPHRRNRLYWIGERLGDTNDTERRAEEPGGNEHHGATTKRWEGDGDVEEPSREGCWMGNPPQLHSNGSEHYRGGDEKSRRSFSELGNSSRSHKGPWDDWDLVGPDPTGKYRRVKPGVRLLAHGATARVAKLRTLGNSIVPPLAAEVIRSWMKRRP